VAIISGVIGGITLIVACLQLAASRKLIPEDQAPSRYIQNLYYCCCSGGYRRTKDVVKEQPQPDPSRDWLLAYREVPHQDISSSYDSQWGMNMSTMIR
jgi:hypothetical protein